MYKHTQLYEIADSHYCDKGLVGPSTTWSANNYVDVYQAYFSVFRNDPITILEVGLGVPGPEWDSKIVHGGNSQGGASLKMWYEFFPNAVIYGADINDAKFLGCDRIKTFKVDQGSAESLSAFKDLLGTTRFDIIIDDASHIADHQQLTLALFFPLLQKGGLYFVEDLNDRGFENTRTGKHGSDTAISTRKIFYEYIKSGKILQPNAFSNITFFDDIESIAFHSPKQILRLRDVAVELIRIVLRKNAKGLLRGEFNPSSHKILALRKKK